MPYIHSSSRSTLDPSIERLAECISGLAPDKIETAGMLNYAVTRLLVKTLPAKRYWALAMGIGTLVCAILEFYRRYVSKYEDGAIKINGDIPEYQE